MCVCIYILEELVTLYTERFSCNFTFGMSQSGVGNQDYGHRDPPCSPRDIVCLQKLALTSRTSGGRSVGIVCSQTKATVLLL
jgi:hypothetical protein